MNKYNIHFDLNNGCNIKCKMCHHRQGLMTPNKQHVMPIKDFENLVLPLVAAAKRFQFGCLHEPTTIPYFSEAVSHISKSRTNTKEIFSGRLTSNMMLLTENKMEHLFASNILTDIQMSCDGIDKETFEKIRIGAKFDIFCKRLKFARELIRQSNFCIKIHIVFTLQPDNEHQLFDLEKWAKDNGADNIIIHKLSGFLSNNHSSNKYLEDVENRFRGEFLPHSNEKYFITQSNGFILHPINGTVIGNLYHDSLETILTRL